jgi:predicted Ser/Thr protein kinase
MISLKYLLGRKVDHFILNEIIGRGGMGTVFKASDTILNRTVALKLMLKGDDSPMSLESQKRLIREAQAAGRLSHPNIVTVYSYGETDEFQYISMEYVAGRNLAQVVAEKQKLELEESLDILQQVFNAMAGAWSEGIVHRDIKPSNILLTKDGRVKVTDFGLARLSSTSSLTLSGTILGTPHYMSPEQILGQSADIRCDIFSAGVVMYELLSGVKPFNADSINAVIYRILHAEPDPISTHHVKIPEFVADIINKAIAKDVNLRYQTPEEILADIAAARQLPSRPDTAENEVTVARPLPEEAAAAREAPTIPEPELKSRTRTGAGRLMPAAVLVAGAAGVLALFLYMKGPTVAPPAAVPAAKTTPAAPPPVVAPEPPATSSPPKPELPVQVETRDTRPAPVPEPAPTESAAADKKLQEPPVAVEPPAKAQPPDDGRQTVLIMLAKAVSAAREGRISSPEGDNALAFYKQAFALGGDNDEIYASIFSEAEAGIGRATIAAGRGESSSARSLADHVRELLKAVPDPPPQQYLATLRKCEAEADSILKRLSAPPKQEQIPKPRTRVQPRKTSPQPTVLKEDMQGGNRILKEDFPPGGKRILKEEFPSSNQ